MVVTLAGWLCQSNPVKKRQGMVLSADICQRVLTVLVVLLLLCCAGAGLPFPVTCSATTCCCSSAMRAACDLPAAPSASSRRASSWRMRSACSATSWSAEPSRAWFSAYLTAARGAGRSWLTCRLKAVWYRLLQSCCLVTAPPAP